MDDSDPPRVAGGADLLAQLLSVSTETQRDVRRMGERLVRVEQTLESAAPSIAGNTELRVAHATIVARIESIAAQNNVCDAQRAILSEKHEQLAAKVWWAIGIGTVLAAGLAEILKYALSHR